MIPDLLSEQSPQAVLLVGGLGTRLRPLTRDVPKPMILVGGVPYLEHQLRYLRRQQIRNVVMLTGYLGRQIEDYFGDGARFGLSVRYSREEEPLGTGGALLQAVSLLDETFLIIYGDSFLPIDYRDLHRRLTSPVQAVLAVYDNRLDDTMVPNNIALDDRGLVMRYDKSSGAPDLTHVDAGVLAMRRSAIELHRGGRGFSLENEIFPKLIARGQLLAYAVPHRFHDIGTPEGLSLFEDALREWGDGS